MSPVGFEPKISAGERPKTYALDRAATGLAELIKYSRNSPHFMEPAGSLRCLQEPVQVGYIRKSSDGRTL